MSATHCFGLVQIGPVRVALPAESLREVVTSPGPATPLPGAADFIPGVTVVRGHPLPVLDLTRLLFSDRPRNGTPPLLVVVDGSRGSLAIEADAVVKVRQADDRSLMPLGGSDPGSSSLVRQVLLDGPDVISVLDPESLLGLPGVRTLNLNPPDAGAGAGTDAAELIGLFRVGQTVLGVPALAIARAMVRPELQGSSLRSRLVRGFFRIENRQMPLIDLLGLLDLAGEAAPDLPERLLILRHEDQALAFGVHDVIGLVNIRADQIQPLRDSGIRQSSAYRGSVSLPPHGQVMLLDPAAVISHPEVSRLRLPLNELRRTGHDGETPVHHLVYHAGSNLLASALTEIEAVAPCPADLTWLRQDGGSFLGLFVWQGRSLPLVDLAAILGEPVSRPFPETARVLVAAVNGARVGYLVSRVESLALACTQPVPWPDPRHADPATADRRVPEFTRMIPLNGPEGRRNASVLALRSVRPESPPVPSAPAAFQGDLALN